MDQITAKQLIQSARSGDLTALGRLLDELAPLVPGMGQANIAAPAGGATVDAEARAAIVSILAALDAAGITV